MDEIAIKENDEIITVNVDEVPEIISSQIDNISELEKKVEASDISAKKAMNYVDGQMRGYKEKGKWIFKHQAGNSKDIIEDTQEAVGKLAEAQQVTVEAMKQSFEFQKKLAQASKYLFNLGCANIAVNRIAVRAIEAKLSGASKEKISDLARQEMISVVRQLKEQEDILKKQEELRNNVKLNKTGIEKNIKSISNIENSLKEKDALEDQQSKRISKNEEAIKLIYDYMKQKDKLDQKRTEEIERIAVKENNMKISIVAIIISSIALIATMIDIISKFI